MRAPPGSDHADLAEGMKILAERMESCETDRQRKHRQHTLHHSLLQGEPLWRVRRPLPNTTRLPYVSIIEDTELMSERKKDSIRYVKALKKEEKIMSEKEQDSLRYLRALKMSGSK